MKRSQFESRLEVLQPHGRRSNWADALIEVLDTAESVVYWLKDHEIPVDSVGVAALTDLVVKRRDSIQEAAEAEIREAARALR